MLTFVKLVDQSNPDAPCVALVTGKPTGLNIAHTVAHAMEWAGFPAGTTVKWFTVNAETRADAYGKGQQKGCAHGTLVA